jgi:nicotinamidase-related amidase
MSYDLSGVTLARAALLVMHYQTDVFEILFGGPRSPLIDRCNELIRQWRGTGRPVIFANFCLGANYEHVAPSNRLMSSIVPTGRFKEARPVAGLAQHSNDWSYSCPRASVFHGTSLHDDLRAQDIGSLVMLGIASSGVMLSSVAWASDADYELHIVKDCCFDPDEEAHEALFRTGFATRAQII